MKQFRDVVVSESVKFGWLNVAYKILLGSWYMLTSRRKPSRAEIRRRYRTCLKCQVHRRQYSHLHGRYMNQPQCRNGMAGCGCYTPYKVFQEDECWGWKYGVGWGRARESERPPMHKEC